MMTLNTKISNHSTQNDENLFQKHKSAQILKHELASVQMFMNINRQCMYAAGMGQQAVRHNTADVKQKIPPWQSFDCPRQLAFLRAETFPKSLRRIHPAFYCVHISGTLHT